MFASPTKIFENEFNGRREVNLPLKKATEQNEYHGHEIATFQMCFSVVTWMCFFNGQKWAGEIMDDT